jgi:hypothetical protein
MIPAEIWQLGPRTTNDYIKNLEQQFFSEKTRQPATAGEIVVPSMQPAAIEPIWERGRLTLTQHAAGSDLDQANFAAALTGLRDELHEFAEDIAGETNIDRRFVSFVGRLADRIPQTPPPQHELFRLGHVEDVFDGYAETVDAEWPDFFRRRYHALSRLFDRTMRQSPLWRAFKRNSEKQRLDAEQISAAASLATETATSLRHDEAKEFVDTGLPDALEQLAEPLQPGTR